MAPRLLRIQNDSRFFYMGQYANAGRFRGAILGVLWSILFVNLKPQPRMQSRNSLVAAELAKSDRAMINSFWIGLSPGQIRGFAVDKLETFLGVDF